MPLNTRKYVTRLTVRPDDIDMFRHVHSSRYIDYVLAARFDQMERCYNCSMKEFLSNGLGWVLQSTELNFHRPLELGEEFDVETHLESFEKSIATVVFSIKKHHGKLACSGWAKYVLIDLNTGKLTPVPDWVMERYSIPDES